MNAPRRGRRALAGLALGVCLTAQLGCAGTEDTPMNLVFVVLDTTRADHMGFLGYGPDTTPNMDALAARSVVFENHYSHASRTGPAVASLITGLHPRSHGVVNPLTEWDAKGTLHEERTTLAELLASAGYANSGVVTNPNVVERFGFAQGFASYEFIGVENGDRVIAATDPLLAADAAQPFFLYLHFMDPHSSYEAPAPYDTMFVDPAYGGRVNGSHGQLNLVLAGRLGLDEADVAQLRALYDQEVRSLDEQLGALLAMLDERGLADDTLICVVADHGEEFLEHGSVLHGYTLYEEQLRVPLLLFDPRRGPARVEGVTRHVDVLPTLLAWLGLPPIETQGHDLTPLVEGQAQPEAPPVFAQASLRAVKTVQQRSLTVDGWKWIETLHPEPGVELYHLDSDPGEARNLRSAEPARADEMRRRMAEYVESLPAAGQTLIELTDEEREKLRSLGYLR